MSETNPPGRRGAAVPWRERAGQWLSEEALTALLLLLLVDMLVLPSIGPGTGDVALNLVFTGLLFTGLATVATRGIAFVVVGLLVVVATALKWAARVPGLPVSPAAATGAAVAVFALLTLLVLLRTLSPGPITRRRIEGAVATYLLIAVTFATSFEMLELLHPGSLRFSEGEPEVLKHAVGYFSMVTLTTVGFGDVTPVTPLARRLAMLEGLIGQLYPAIIIGWMVSAMRPGDD
jgi:voltage-gated potassium channel Kch